MAEVAAAAASLDSMRSASIEQLSRNDLLTPSKRADPDQSPARSQNGTRASSVEDEKTGQQDDRARQHSTTVSGSSSVSGTNNGGNNSQTILPPLSAKKGPQSFFSGSKIKHLKKADGIPLWRVDIQYEFLYGVFRNTQPVFTNTYNNKQNQTFADIYIDAMARSSKTSKILRDKLLSERENALNMAMVCLLVNVGRMNTTLNFFPEMKAQLRTYHAIPSLQAHTDSSAYKQLQDAPRLKSILKGACEDRTEPQTLEQVMNTPKPRTNPINLVFILSTYAPKISESHFPENMDFYDLVMRTTLSSKSRARAFLWLMWHYLEGEFTDRDGLDNPFGKGKLSRDKKKPWCVPDFEYLTEEQAAKENVDPPDELEYGNAKNKERLRLLEDFNNNPPAPGRVRGGRRDKGVASPSVQSPSGSPPASSARRGGRSHFASYDYDESDARTRSGSPDNHYTPVQGNKGIRRVSSIAKVNMLNPDIASSPADTPRSRGGRPRALGKRTADGEFKSGQKIILTKGGRPLAPPDDSSRLLFPADRSSPVIGERAGPRPRMTAHQVAVQQNRRDRVNHEVDRQLLKLDRKKRKTRLKEGAVRRAWARIKEMEEPLMLSDDEDRSFKHSTDFYDEESIKDDYDHPHAVKRARVERFRRSNGDTLNSGPAGIVPCLEEQLGDDADDYGEQAMSYAAALRRTRRRLERWSKADNNNHISNGGEEQQLPENGEDQSSADEDEVGASKSTADAEDVSDEDEDMY